MNIEWVRAGNYTNSAVLLTASNSPSTQKKNFPLVFFRFLLTDSDSPHDVIPEVLIRASFEYSLRYQYQDTDRGSSDSMNKYQVERATFQVRAILHYCQCDALGKINMVRDGPPLDGTF